MGGHPRWRGPVSTHRVAEGGSPPGTAGWPVTPSRHDRADDRARDGRRELSTGGVRMGVESGERRDFRVRKKRRKSGKRDTRRSVGRDQEPTRTEIRRFSTAKGARTPRTGQCAQRCCFSALKLQNPPRCWIGFESDGLCRAVVFVSQGNLEDGAVAKFQLK